METPCRYLLSGNLVLKTTWCEKRRVKRDLAFYECIHVIKIIQIVQYK